jgi:hypothetical protein
VSSQHSSTSESSQTPKRTGWQFSLRTLFVFVLLLGCLLAWIAVKRVESHRRERARAAIAKAGGAGVSRDYPGEKGTTDRNWWQRFLFGDDSYAHVHRIYLARSNDPDAALAECSAFPELESLILEESQVTDTGLAFLASHKNLKRLSLIKTKITDNGLSSLAGLTQLEQLYLGGNPQLTEAGMKHLQSLTNLKRLGIEDSRITDEGFMAKIATFSKLEFLSLSRTIVSDASVANLVKLTQLNELWLNDTHISEAGVATLKKALPKCGIVHDQQPNKE